MSSAWDEQQYKLVSYPYEAHQYACHTDALVCRPCEKQAISISYGWIASPYIIYIMFRTSTLLSHPFDINRLMNKIYSDSSTSQYLHHDSVRTYKHKCHYWLSLCDENPRWNPLTKGQLYGALMYLFLLSRPIKLLHERLRCSCFETPWHSCDVTVM